MLKHAVAADVVERMKSECSNPKTRWNEGINDHVKILEGDRKRYFSTMDMNTCLKHGYDPTAVLREYDLDELLRETTAAKGTGIKQLPGCAEQITHTDYEPDTRAFNGTSVPFGCLLALTKRRTYVLPRSHKTQCGQVSQNRMVVNCDPGDVLLIRGVLRHGGGYSNDETYGHHTYFDRPGMSGGTHLENEVHI